MLKKSKKLLLRNEKVFLYEMENLWLITLIKTLFKTASFTYSSTFPHCGLDVD